jgi:hypothetical protein
MRVTRAKHTFKRAKGGKLMPWDGSERLLGCAFEKLQSSGFTGTRFLIRGHDSSYEGIAVLLYEGWTENSHLGRKSPSR